MNKFLKNTLLIDGSHMLMRAMTQPGLSDLYTTTGIASGGVFGFLRMFVSVLYKNQDYYPICIWDKGRSQRRLDLFPNYKHTLDRANSTIEKGSDDDIFLSNLRIQRESVMDFLSNVNVPNIRINGWEGDDLIYLLSQSSENCMIVSDDKDMIQMCSPTCKINRSMKGEIIDYTTCDENYKYPQYEYSKAIIGDGSDNIPKCMEGVGGSSANKIAEVMTKYVLESGCDIHDYEKIFNHLKSNTLESEWKQVRGLSKKIIGFTSNEVLEKFKLNMLLTDFHYVTAPQEIYDSIESEILNTLNKGHDIYNADSLLSIYEITNISSSQIAHKLNKSKHLIV